MVISWTRAADSPFARVNHQAVHLNEAFYIFGGFNSQLREVNKNYQIDVFRWNIRRNAWEELPYPLRLRAWDCVSKSWSPDPVLSGDGSIQPVHRFGHTVVAWRGRGWLFGGRTHQQVCSNQLYMFDPGEYRLPVSKSPELVEVIQPCWAEVLGTTGTAPSPRDGHAAAVLENAMFIFGGFEDRLDNYDNQVYRFDFTSWSWMLIEIRDRPSRLDFHEGTDTITDTSVDDNEGLLLTHRSPLPRDFTSLIGHRGRLFVFGGRSECSVRRGYDIYDSALWELIPLSIRRTNISIEQPGRIDEELVPLKPADCQFCSAEKFEQLATLDELRRMAWEEETGNWINSECWATSPPRPCCLWRVFTDEFSDVHRDAAQHVHNGNNVFHLFTTPVSRWHTGRATWRRLHPGHGLQLPDQLLPRLFGSVTVTRGSSSSGSITVAPYGRRSLSHWAYMGHLYIGFGTVRCQLREQWQLHYEDVWRFDLADESWYSVRTAARVGLCDYHQPSARRRAVACLYVPRPRLLDHRRMQPLRLERPWVFLFGGTQPRILNESGPDSHRSLRGNPRPFELFPSHPTFLGTSTQPLTQNRLLGLGDGNSISLVNVSKHSIASFTWDTITSPIALLLINTKTNSYTEHLTDLFYLIIVTPRNFTSSSIHSVTSQYLTQCSHLDSLHTVCVFNLNDVVDMLHSPVASHKPIGQLIFCNRYLGSDQDRLHLYQALNLSWFILNSFEITGMDALKRVGGGGHRLQLLLVEQTTTQSSDGYHLSMGYSNQSRGIINASPGRVLEHVYFVLCESGNLYQHTLTRVRAPHLLSSPSWFQSVMLRAVDLLNRCVMHFIKHERLIFPSQPASLTVKKSTTDCPRCGVSRSIHILIDQNTLCDKISSQAYVEGDVPSSNSITITVALSLHRFLSLIHNTSTFVTLSHTHTSLLLPSSLNDGSPSISGETVHSPHIWYPDNEPEVVDLEDPIISEPSSANTDMAIDHTASSDSDDATPSERITIDGVGVLVKGKEKLLELPDCYIMNLDTSLYDLCLRHLRSINPNVLQLFPILPFPILRQLQRIHSPPSSTNILSRQSDSG